MSLNVSAYSIKNPLVAILLFVLLTLGGLYGFMQMKVQQFPDIDLPAVVVTVTLPGAAPSQLENDIAKKIENKLTSIGGVKHIRTTLQTGAATMVTEFVLEKISKKRSTMCVQRSVKCRATYQQRPMILSLRRSQLPDSQSSPIRWLLIT